MDPRTCDIVQDKNASCKVEAYLYPAINSKKKSPLQIYNEFSRFKVTIIEHGNTSAYINIPADKIDNVLKESEYAFIKEKEFVGNDAPSSAAYTVRFTMGKLKGKSPAEVLIEQDLEGVNALKNQYIYLEKFVQQYPNNRKTMDAIEEAMTLYKSGQLTQTTPATAILLYNADIKVLENHKNKNGKSFVYSVQIRWELGQKRPVVISMKNYYANTTMNGSLVNPVGGTEEDMKLETYRLTYADWNRICQRIKDNQDIFKQKYGADLLTEAERLENEVRIKAGYRPY